MTHSVSVVIPNFNYGRYLPEAIDSVLEQSYPVREIIVVDDGSVDESLATLERYAASISIIKQENQGVGAARNTGARAASGDIIAFLDADDIWDEKKIEKQVAKFNEDPSIGLVSVSMEEFNASGEKLGIYTQELEGKIAADMLRFDRAIVVSGSAIAVRRSVFEKVGGFDENRELHPSEDWEFCFRVAKGSNVAFVDEPLVRYRNHGGNGHLAIGRMERAMLLAFRKIYTDQPELAGLRNDSMANLYGVLSGSYLHAGQYLKAFKTGVLSIRYRPAKIGRLAGLPFRRIGNRIAGRGT